MTVVFSGQKMLFFLIIAVALALLSGCATTKLQASVCGDYICESDEMGVCNADCESVGSAAAAQDDGTGYTVDTVDIAAGASARQNSSSGGGITNCIESDNGNNVAVQGYVAGNCADCDQGVIGGNSDSCVLQAGQRWIASSQATHIMEFYCTGEGWEREITECPNGCSQGACLG